MRLILCVLAGCTMLGQAQTISGTVTDQTTGQPLAGAAIRVQATEFQALSAVDGSFSLNVPAALGLQVVAAAKGYYYRALTLDSPSSGTLFELEGVPLEDDPAYLLRDPGSCSSCHPKQYGEWVGTPMSRAGFNTWVHDIYNGSGTPGGLGGFVYVRDSVHAAANPNSECASCHQPQHWIENPMAALDDDTANPTPAVLHGVSCEVCHKVADVSVANINYPGLFPGAAQFTRPTSDQVMYGILGDVAFDVSNVMRGSLQPQLVAETCGLCHQDKNDPDGTHAFDGVTSEPTYTEWAESAYGDPQSLMYRTCVDCHMPISSDQVVCTVIPTPPRQPERVRSHQILGTSAEFLEHAVELTVDLTTQADQLLIDVELFNAHTGHHVPTGVTIRNMILLVEAWPQGGDPINDALIYTGNQLVHDLGGIGDPQQGYFAGLPGKYFSKVNHDASGQGPTFFTDATGILFDNRIPALQSDFSQYRFQLPPGTHDIDVRVRLIYRRSFRFLVDAKQWTEDGHGNLLEDLVAPHFGHLMESYENQITTQVAFPVPTFSPWMMFGFMAAIVSAALAFAISHKPN